MSYNNYQELIARVFKQLHQNGFWIGVGELLAAEAAVNGGFGKDLAAVKETLKMLWCHSLFQQKLFDDIFKSVDESLQIKPLKDKSSTKAPENIDNQGKPELDPEIQKPSEDVKSPREDISNRQPEPEPKLEPLPVSASFQSMEIEVNFDLQTYYPLSRRSMVYGWRYLYRSVADGRRDVLDINATIKQVTRQGFYLVPVYRRRERNNAHLLLLVDQNGSMTPFHRFSRDLVETALYESPLTPENIQVFYFQNVPGTGVYKDIYLTERIALNEVLKTCDHETSILIVSDAGAARGYRTLNRIRATSRFLFKLQQHTDLIAWLNPMPEERWFGSSAEIIAYLIPMYQMAKIGFGNAIDIVRC